MWLRGVLFGGILATLLTSLFVPKSGIQLRKKLLRVKTSGTKKGRALLRNSKHHTREFAEQTKTLAKNISKEIQDFTQSIIDESRRD
ncbi:ytxH-like family protein [Chlamydia muridarum]|nr:ytxH-like family protein [Chlamydia muridarum]KDU82343.1 ytxH-like family protein [Chlamydia muridarum]KDU83150.1 ytxH-like family protein [Chlamydia muridarum]KDU84655.1 ytxH-like family protein [Chlamydia muridarum]